MDFNYERSPKQVSSAYDEASNLIELAYRLDADDGAYVEVETYSEKVWLTQPESRLVTVIQSSNIPDGNWLDTLAIYQEKYVPSETEMGRLDINVVMYKLQSDGKVYQCVRSRVGVVGREGWHHRKLEPEEATALAENLSSSTVMPPALMKYAT